MKHNYIKPATTVTETVESLSPLMISQDGWADAKKQNPGEVVWEDDEKEVFTTRAFRGYTGGRVLEDNLSMPCQHSLYE